MNISVIIPCRNEEHYIEECIQAFLKQDYDLGKFEVLVIDGMSDDDTRKIIHENFSNNKKVRIVDNKRKTTPFALNKGIEESKYEYIIIFGAHAKPKSDFLKRNALAIDEDESIKCAGGIIHNVYLDDTAKYIGLAMSSKFGVGNAIFRTGGKKQYVDTVAFGIYDKSVFKEIGVFDVDLVRNQDDELNYRVTKNKYKILFDPKIQSEYFVRGSLTKLYKQYFQYGYWKVFVAKKHNSVTTFRQLVPLLFFLFITIGGILALISTTFTYLYLIGLLSYVLLAFTSSIILTNSFKAAINVFLVFPTLHWSYGWGYFKGLIDFYLIKKKPGEKHEKITR